MRTFSGLGATSKETMSRSLKLRSESNINHEDLPSMSVKCSKISILLGPHAKAMSYMGSH